MSSQIHDLSAFAPGKVGTILNKCNDLLKARDDAPGISNEARLYVSHDRIDARASHNASLSSYMHSSALEVIATVSAVNGVAVGCRVPLVLLHSTLVFASLFGCMGAFRQVRFSSTLQPLSSNVSSLTKYVHT